jgi:hypothetical protein
VTIAASAVSISASSVAPLAHIIPPYTSGRSEPPIHLCPPPLAPIEIS